MNVSPFFPNILSFLINFPAAKQSVQKIQTLPLFICKNSENIIIKSIIKTKAYYQIVFEIKSENAVADISEK